MSVRVICPSFVNFSLPASPPPGSNSAAQGGFMSFSRSAWIRLAALALAASLSACEGGASSNVSDGGFDRVAPSTGGDGPKLDTTGGTRDAGPSTVDVAIPPPPMLNPAGAKILDDGWEMLGTHGTGC